MVKLKMQSGYIEVKFWFAKKSGRWLIIQSLKLATRLILSCCWGKNVACMSQAISPLNDLEQIAPLIRVKQAFLQ